MQYAVCFWLIVDILMQTKRQILLHFQVIATMQTNFVPSAKSYLNTIETLYFVEASSSKVYMSSHQIAITQMLLWIICSKKIQKRWFFNIIFLTIDFSEFRLGLYLSRTSIYQEHVLPEWFCELPVVWIMTWDHFW